MRFHFVKSCTRLFRNALVLFCIYKISAFDRNGLLIENANRGVTFEGSLELKYNVAARGSRPFFYGNAKNRRKRNKAKTPLNGNQVLFYGNLVK